MGGGGLSSLVAASGGRSVAGRGTGPRGAAEVDGSMPVTPTAVTASRTRSTRWRWPGRRCVTRTCLSPASTVRRGGCRYSSITVRTWSTSVRGGSTGCGEHLNELDAEWDPPKQALRRLCQLDAIISRLAAIEAANVDSVEGVVARIAGEIAARVRQLTVAETALEREISTLVAPLAENLLDVVGVGATDRGEDPRRGVADITRFRDANAFARHTGTAPVPASSGGTQRHRLSPHRQPPTQRRPPPRRSHPDPLPPARPRTSNGDTPTATAPPKPPAPSNDDSPTSSTAPYTPTPTYPPPHSHKPLDIGATD